MRDRFESNVNLARDDRERIPLDGAARMEFLDQRLPGHSKLPGCGGRSPERRGIGKCRAWMLPVLCLILAGCGQRGVSPADAGRDQARAPASTLPAAGGNPMPDPAGLHNLMKVSDQIYSGGEPHGEEGFESLRQLGIKTVVSVDGAKPKVELARQHGIRYVHIPLGYGGISQEAGQMLARVVRDAEGSFYFHCHHGKHRGPAAVAVACIASGDSETKEGAAMLERAGTSKDYAGLWRDVENYVRPPADAKLPELMEAAEVSSFIAAMAQIDRAYDHLKLCREANWKTPPDHPDLVPAQEALLLQEGLFESARHLDQKYDEQFKVWLTDAERAASQLLAALKEENEEEAGDRLKVIEQSCRQCHRRYRN